MTRFAMISHAMLSYATLGHDMRASPGRLLEIASRGHFSYRFVHWRGLPGPAAGKWPPEATFRIDLYAGGTSLGHLLGNGLRRPLFV